MHAPNPRPHGARISLALLAAFCATIGCRPADEIKTYRIAKPSDESPPPAKPVAERTGEPTDRMLAAIVPGPDQAWFFKAIGPRAALDPVSESIGAYLKSIRFEGTKPTWETPEGWTEQSGGGMRLATLMIPGSEGGEPIELSVIGLGLVDEWDAQVLDNVNRWLGQIGRPPVDADGLVEAVTPIDDVADGAVLLDQTGWFDGGGMPPFAGRAAPAKPPAARPPSRNELKYETPDGWNDGEVSSMRKASFRTPGGAEVTAFAFAAAGQMGDPLGNANRWRGEVKLPPTTQEDLDAESEAITLLGEPGRYFEFVGPDETTYAAMVVRGELAWFFKIRGPGDEVAGQREAFRGWLDTLSL
ncbi:hypothetical protein MalM25_26180 [Planctomycetes bacterium MalM25]|nr:hypothetical protein MalM25_26180 [Planctomycetes bacterium MalM25]